MTWSPERRARQSAAIKTWAPWRKSTGPRTSAGKAKSCMNAYKGPLRRPTLGDLDRLRRGFRHIGKAAKPNANELLDRQASRFLGLAALYLRSIGGAENLVNELLETSRFFREIGAIEQLRKPDGLGTDDPPWPNPNSILNFPTSGLPAQVRTS